MKRKTYNKMKDLGWDKFVEHMIANNLKPEDLLNKEGLTEVQVYLFNIELIKQIEKTLYSINWES